MAVHNAFNKEIIYKIAYHGPGMGGKTTNLRFIHSALPGKEVGQFLVLDSAVERTLYYDFLPLIIPIEDGYKVRFHLYTVPGQSYYDASRKLVLNGVDGIVFVADSNAERMDDNIESMALLKKDLADVGVDYGSIALVMQYNKRDLPNVSLVDDLEGRLNDRKTFGMEAVARDGIGVFETLSEIVDRVTGVS